MNFENRFSIWCKEHWQIVIDHQLNGTLATLRMIDCCLSNEKFMRRCGWSPELRTQAETKRINLEMKAIAPVCCWLGEEVMKGIFEEIRPKEVKKS